MNGERPLYLGFASQKGGVGKSTIAEVVSSILHYELGYKVLVADVDYVQSSFYKLRVREQEYLSKEENENDARYVLDYYDRMGIKKPYDIISDDFKYLIKPVEWFIARKKEKGEDADYDFVLFDFPGYADNEQILTLMTYMDYLFSPLEPDIQSLESSTAFVDAISKWLEDGWPPCFIRGIYVFWNKVRTNSRKEEISEYSEKLKDLGVSVCDSRISNAVRFSQEMVQSGARDAFRSTYLPPRKSLVENVGVLDFVNELIAITNINELKDAQGK